MKKIPGLFALFVLSSLAASQALAWPPTFGTEFNFTSSDLEDGWFYRTLAGKSGDPDEVEQEAAQKLSERIKRLCAPDCEVITHKGKWKPEFKIQFSDGWYFNISIDPGVVEIQTAPATREELASTSGLMQKRIQKYIFDAAEGEGLAAYRPPGANQELAAHLNIGALSAFEDDPKSFMRFFADYANHPELGMGLLADKDFLNAPPVRALHPEQQKALQEIIDQVNRGRLKSVPQIARAIHDHVYTGNPALKEEADLRSRSAARHYQGIGLKQLNNGEFPKQDRPLEIRAMRQPRNAAEYALQVDLIQARLEHVRAQRDPVLFIPGTAETLTAEELAGRFYIYVNEMGLDWRKYEPLLTPSTRKALEEAKIPDILMGKGNMTGPETDGIIQHYLVDQITISPWARARLAALLRENKLTRTQAAVILSRVAGQSGHGLDHAVIVEKYLEGIKDDPALARYRETALGALGQARTAKSGIKPEKALCAARLLRWFSR